jgi:hypothetical protein
MAKINAIELATLHGIITMTKMAAAFQANIK